MGTFSRRESLKWVGAAGALSVLGGGPTARAADPVAGTDLQGAGFYRRKLGEVELIVVSDGVFAFPGAHPLFGGNVSKEEVEKTLADSFIKPDEVEGHVHVLLVRSGKDLVLIDTGCGSFFGPTTGKLLPRLANAGIKPADITAVVLTHAHRDHLGGLLDAEGKPNFPNAECIIARTEFDFWTKAPDLSKSGLPPEMHKGFIESAQTVLGKLKWTQIDAEADVRPRIRAIPAPGHTPGHLTFIIDGGGTNQLYYITDAVHHYAIVMPHPEYYVAFDADRELAVATRKKVLDRAAADRLLISGTHLPFPSVGHVRRREGGFEWAPEPWRW